MFNGLRSYNDRYLSRLTAIRVIWTLSWRFKLGAFYPMPDAVIGHIGSLLL